MRINSSHVENFADKGSNRRRRSGSTDFLADPAIQYIVKFSSKARNDY